MKSSVLIVDDDSAILSALQALLEKKYLVMTAKKASAALQLFQWKKPDLILLDIGLPDMSGIDVLKRVKKIDPETVVIMVTAREEVKTIVEAVKLGAFDYLVKPVDAENLFLTIQNALENRRLKNQIRVLQQQSIKDYKFDLIGVSSQTKAIIEMAMKASHSVDTPLLILGETGSGKGVLAKAIHYSRPDPGPFLTVNCSAIAKDLVESELFGYEQGAFTGAKAEGKKGHFEDAAGGTLFLDEIGTMPLSTQVKLLGVIDDRTFCRVGGTKAIQLSARIIAATNSDLEGAVNQHEFRRDLYYRLNVVKIEVPPLRDRLEDIVPLAEHFMAHYNAKFGKHFTKISSEAQHVLLHYNWPGNVRELRNTLERIILLEEGDTLLTKHFSFNPELSKEKGRGDFQLEFSRGGITYDEAIKTLIKEALKRTRGNVLEAARVLEMPAHKLRYRIKKYRLGNAMKS